MKHSFSQGVVQSFYQGVLLVLLLSRSFACTPFVKELPGHTSFCQGVAPSFVKELPSGPSCPFGKDSRSSGLAKVLGDCLHSLWQVPVGVVAPVVCIPFGPDVDPLYQGLAPFAKSLIPFAKGWPL